MRVYIGAYVFGNRERKTLFYFGEQVGHGLAVVQVFCVFISWGVYFSSPLSFDMYLAHIMLGCTYHSISAGQYTMDVLRTLIAPEVGKAEYHVCPGTQKLFSVFFSEQCFPLVLVSLRAIADSIF